MKRKEGWAKEVRGILGKGSRTLAKGSDINLIINGSKVNRKLCKA